MEELIKFIGIRINEVALSLIQVINSKKSLVTCIGTWKCNSHIFVTFVWCFCILQKNNSQVFSAFLLILFMFCIFIIFPLICRVRLYCTLWWYKDFFEKKFV
jgi:hypothetical protein